MSIIALIIFLFTIGVGGLILTVAYKNLRRSSLKSKLSDLELLDEQHQVVVEASNRFTKVKEKREEIKKFNDQ